MSRPASCYIAGHSTAFQPSTSWGRIQLLPAALPPATQGHLSPSSPGLLLTFDAVKSDNDLNSLQCLHNTRSLPCIACLLWISVDLCTCQVSTEGPESPCRDKWAKENSNGICFNATNPSGVCDSCQPPLGEHIVITVGSDRCCWM